MIFQPLHIQIHNIYQLTLISSSFSTAHLGHPDLCKPPLRGRSSRLRSRTGIRHRNSTMFSAQSAFYNGGNTQHMKTEHRHSAIVAEQSLYYLYNASLVAVLTYRRTRRLARCPVNCRLVACHRPPGYD